VAVKCFRATLNCELCILSSQRLQPEIDFNPVSDNEQQMKSVEGLHFINLKDECFSFVNMQNFQKFSERSGPLNRSCLFLEQSHTVAGSWSWSSASPQAPRGRNTDAVPRGCTRQAHLPHRVQGASGMYF
jgi:hypothetical protein